MGFYVSQCKTKSASAGYLFSLFFLGACHHDHFASYQSASPHFEQDLAYCELLARSVAAQYDPYSDSLWFYQFGHDETGRSPMKDKHKQRPKQLSDLVNFETASDAQFVNFTALSLYDVTYQHKGFEAVISLCLERKGYPTDKADVRLASAL